MPVAELPGRGFQPVPPLVGRALTFDRRPEVVYDLAQVPDLGFELADKRFELHIGQRMQVSISH